MTWLAFGLVLLVACAASYVAGAVTAYRIAMEVWAQHERTHDRGWPTRPRPYPPPPRPPRDLDPAA